jgi:cytoskeleton protein RodZ
MTESIGQQLQRARLRRGLTIEQVEEATKIRAYYLKALEEDDYLTLPSMVQGRGFLRIYASFLDLDTSDLVPQLEANSGKPIQEALEKSPHRLKPEVDDSSPPSPSSPDGGNKKKPEQPNPSPVSVTQESSNTIFLEIGIKLAERREILGLSLADVERYTHLRIHYLESLEAGKVNELPSTVQGRGMLSNYSHFLNLDTDALLLRYADGLQARRTERPGNPPSHHQPATQISKNRLALRRFISFDLAIGSLLIITLVAFVVWGTTQVLEIQKQEAISYTLPPVSEVLLGTDDSTSSETIEVDTIGTEPTLTPQPTQQAGFSGTLNFTALPSGNEPIQIYIICRQTAWIRVLVEDKTEYEGRMKLGSAYSFASNVKMEIITGNAAAFQIYFNQTDLGPLGATAEVIDLVFNIDGLVLPTATSTPIITITSPISETPLQSPGPSETVTTTPTLTNN